MSEDKTLTKIMTVSNKMRSNGENMPNKKIVEKILCTLTEKFTYIVVSIEESKDTDNMSIDELQSSLVVHEQKFRRTSNDDEDQVLKVKGRSGISNRGKLIEEEDAEEEDQLSTKQLLNVISVMT